MMATEKPAKPSRVRADLNELRYGDLPIADLKKQVAELAQIHTELSAVVASAERLGIQQMHVDGITKLPRALTVAREATVCMDVALTKARRAKRP